MNSRRRKGSQEPSIALMEHVNVVAGLSTERAQPPIHLPLF